MHTHFTICLMFFVYIVQVNAQKSINLQTLNRSYAPLISGESLTDNLVWDDPSFIYTPPFSGGFLKDNSVEFGMLNSFLGGILVGVTEDEAILFIPTSMDLIDRGFLDEVSQSNIITAVTEIDQKNALVFEWVNAGFYDELDNTQISTSYVNFQVIVYENEPYIEYHYGPSKFTTSDKEFSSLENGTQLIGLQYIDISTNQTKDFLALQGVMTDPKLIAVDIETEDEFNALDGFPKEDIVYRFVLETSSLKNLFNNAVQASIRCNLISHDIEIVCAEDMTFYYKIFGPNGKLVSRGQCNSGSMIDMSWLSSGQYYIQLSQYEKITKTLKFIKQ